MNILLIHQYYLPQDAPGGSRFNEMSKEWVNSGAKITVLCGMIYHNSGNKYKEYVGKFLVKETYGELTVIRCHDSEGGQKSFIKRLWVYLSFVFSSTIAGIFKATDKYDIIIVTSPPLFVGITAYLLSCFKRIPFIFEIRDLWPESAIDTGVLKSKLIIRMAYWFEAFIYKKATLINVLTPAFRDALINRKNVSPKKIIYVPNAADFALSEDLLQNFDVNTFKKEQNLEGKFVITYVGAHGVANHLIQIIQAAELLRDNPAVLFLLIGDGMEKAMLIDETNKRALKNVRFVNSVPKKEVFKYILASDMGSSILKKVDTFKTVYSNKTFDYMSCKKPILMLIDGVSRELVETADCGIYVEPENTTAFKSAILLYFNNKNLLKQQGESGYTYAHQYFNRHILASQYLEHIRKIVK
jgi:glycosyltransferase involved in cell wall biosynthesis